MEMMALLEIVIPFFLFLFPGADRAGGPYSGPMGPFASRDVVCRSTPNRADLMIALTPGKNNVSVLEAHSYDVSMPNGRASVGKETSNTHAPAELELLG
jgi:hypothetical protein